MILRIKYDLKYKYKISHLNNKFTLKIKFFLEQYFIGTKHSCAFSSRGRNRYNLDEFTYIDAIDIKNDFNI